MSKTVRESEVVAAVAVPDVVRIEAAAGEPDLAPCDALGHVAQARLTAELLSALGSPEGSVRPRYRRSGLP